MTGKTIHNKYDADHLLLLFQFLLTEKTKGESSCSLHGRLCFERLNCEGQCDTKPISFLVFIVYKKNGIQLVMEQAPYLTHIMTFSC